MIETILFDLDGTLLPMNQDVFIKEYFGTLAKKLLPCGYNPEKLVDAIWRSSFSMLKNDGTRLNEEVFWDNFAKLLGEGVKEDAKYFDEYYERDFDNVKSVCGFTPKSKEIIDYVKSKGISVSLATNPLFPSIATEKRIMWAGLKPSDFEIYTTYENSHYSKPNLKYYEEIIEKLSINPEKTLMVGNDVDDDMVAEALGMKVFLLTDCLINKDNKDISKYPSGSFDDLREFIDKNV